MLTSGIENQVIFECGSMINFKVNYWTYLNDEKHKTRSKMHGSGSCRCWQPPFCFTSSLEVRSLSHFTSPLVSYNIILVICILYFSHLHGLLPSVCNIMQNGFTTHYIILIWKHTIMTRQLGKYLGVTNCDHFDRNHQSFKGLPKQRQRCVENVCSNCRI